MARRVSGKEMRCFQRPRRILYFLAGDGRQDHGSRYPTCLSEHGHTNRTK